MLIQKSKSKKPVIVASAIILVLAGYTFAAYMLHWWPFLKTAIAPSASDPSVVDSQAAIDQQKKAFTDQQNADTNNSNAGTSNSSTTKKPATVVVTGTDQYGSIIDVRSYVSDVYENGTCTIVFTRGSDTVTKQTLAYTDATTTICTNPQVSRSEFPSSGNWNLVVTYESASAKGSSGVQVVSIQ